MGVNISKDKSKPSFPLLPAKSRIATALKVKYNQGADIFSRSILQLRITTMSSIARHKSWFVVFTIQTCTWYFSKFNILGQYLPTLKAEDIVIYNLNKLALGPLVQYLKVYDLWKPRFHHFHALFLNFKQLSLYVLQWYTICPTNLVVPTCWHLVPIWRSLGRRFGWILSWL